MKIFVTGVNGQLGHDVMNDLAARNHIGIGSDLKKAYFDEIEMPAFYGTNIFVFICGGQCVKLDTNENISKLTNNAIMVLDNPNLIQNDDD